MIPSLVCFHPHLVLNEVKERWSGECSSQELKSNDCTDPVCSGVGTWCRQSWLAVQCALRVLAAGLLCCALAVAGVRRVRRWHPSDAAMLTRYLVDPASSHMLVSKIKPCMSKYTPS